MCAPTCRAAHRTLVYRNTMLDINPGVWLELWPARSILFPSGLPATSAVSQAKSIITSSSNLRFVADSLTLDTSVMSSTVLCEAGEYVVLKENRGAIALYSADFVTDGAPLLPTDHVAPAHPSHAAAPRYIGRMSSHTAVSAWLVGVLVPAPA